MKLDFSWNEIVSKDLIDRMQILPYSLFDMVARWVLDGDT